ncbi:MAG: GNAT family N-acetyltransferase [Candidatus Hodarchaeales archaeon]
MKIQSRPYNKQHDFTRIMRFLANLFESTKSYENWFPDRFENSSDSREDAIRVWERLDDTINPSIQEIIAVTTRDSPIDFFLHVDPNYKHIEREMIKWIEEHHKKSIPREKNEIDVKINILEGNVERESLLSELGYNKKQIYGYYRIRQGNTSIPEYQCPEIFEIRTLKHSDYEQLALLIRRVFGHGESFNAGVLEWIACCSFYNPELDLVIVTPEDTIASFCTFRIDPISHIISLEPMGTNPDFRGLGLGKAILTEGIKRSMKFNPPFFYIDGAADTPAANRLYDVTGFTEKYAINSWIKRFV